MPGDTMTSVPSEADGVVDPPVLDTPSSNPQTNPPPETTPEIPSSSNPAPSASTAHALESDDKESHGQDPPPTEGHINDASVPEEHHIDSGSDVEPPSIKSPKVDSSIQATRRAQGVQARAQKRTEVVQLQQEVAVLQESVRRTRTIHMCMGCTGLQELLKTNPTLVHDMSTVNQNLTMILQVMKQTLGAGAARLQELPALNGECMKLLCRLSKLKRAAAWHGAALMVLNDGMVMHHPALFPQVGDVPMAAWLVAFVRGEGSCLSPELRSEVAVLLQSWTAFEEDLRVLISDWMLNIHRNGISNVQRDLAARIRPGSTHGSFLLGQPANAPQDKSYDTHDLQHYLPTSSDSMPEELLCCCNIVQNNERFRCLALEIMQTKLEAADFASFLCTRLTMANSVAILLDYMEQAKSDFAAVHPDQ